MAREDVAEPRRLSAAKGCGLHSWIRRYGHLLHQRTSLMGCGAARSGKRILPRKSGEAMVENHRAESICRAGRNQAMNIKKTILSFAVRVFPGSSKPSRER